MANLIQLRRDSSIAWNNVNPVLSQGEPGFEIDSGRVKIGDGINSWSNLPYIKTLELPSNAEGYLSNDGDGNISWNIIPERFSGAYADLTGKPNFSNVATSGNYNDLNNKPFIPTDLSQITDNTDQLAIVRQFNSIAENLIGFDFGTIIGTNVATKIEWILLSIDIDNGTITQPVNINHDAGPIDLGS